MLVIGLTGGIGSGKSTVAHLFAQKGVLVIDADQITRDLTQLGKPSLKTIAERFGQSVLNNDQTLNRKKLRERIFSNKEDKRWLEALLHPLVWDEIKRQVLDTHAPYVIAMIPLLLESKKNPLINRVLVVDSPVTLQLKRATERDRLSESEIEAVIRTQITREERLKAADDIIHNEGSLEALGHEVDQLHQFYLNLQANSQ